MYSANKDDLMHPWWDFKSAIAIPLGHTMVYWARHGIAYPLDFTPEEWSATLYMHGCALLRYGDLQSSTSDLIDEDEAEAEAKVAMQWIADNFEKLWD